MYRDIVFALRQLGTNLRFGVIVVLTLALGIGATTAIFSIVSGVLLRALPFPDSERIVSLQTIEYPHAEAEAKEANVGTLNDVSFPDFFDWRRQSQTLEAVASYSYGTVRKFTPRGNGLPRIVGAEYVSADFFRVLGVTPAVGRSFTLEDESDDSRPVILSYPFWVAEFHSSPDIVGVSGDFRQPLYLLFGAVTAVLLIACANVAGLLLARGFARRHEFRVRVALGAKPSHIVRQVLVESTMLALCGGAIGIALAFVLLKTVLGLAPADLPRIAQVRIDGIVLAFAFLVSLVTGVVFGVFPAWSASRSDSSGLWRAGRGVSGGRGEHRLRGIFVIAETAISLVLLGGTHSSGHGKRSPARTCLPV
jgi:hypothetical protein